MIRTGNTDRFTIYFAGALFDHRQLTGNALLADAIEQGSDGWYQVVLPQNLEQATNRAVTIRNQDLKQVIACDLALFNFDGTELDSGTVVEFMMAKFLDIPSVILRSDFRLSGDQGKEGDAWNLMCSFYPRTRVVQFNAMAWNHEARAGSGTLQDCYQRLYRRIASELIDQFDAVRQEPSLFAGDIDWTRRLYEWAARFPGSGMTDTCSSDFLAQIVEAKRRKGMGR